MDKFFEKIKKTETCWIWQGDLQTNGYGRIQIKGERFKAHRLSYSIFKGDIPAGMCVCHSCDNPSCVNPEHLWLGTPKDNAQDMFRKGRAHKQHGSFNNAAKLSEKDVYKIRELAASGIHNNQIAAVYNVAPDHIKSIKNGRRWGWLK